MAGSIKIKNNIGSELSITHADNKSAKSIIGSDIAVAVDTINDFPLDANDGDTVIVRDLDRGGTFIYDSSKVAEHNDGTNFNGWIRQYSGPVNVKWYISASDTSDDIGIQKALTNSLVLIDDNYSINNTLVITNKVTIYGTGSISTSADINIFSIDNVNDVTINGIEANGLVNNSFVYCRDSDNIEIDNCNISNLSLFSTNDTGRVYEDYISDSMYCNNIKLSNNVCNNTEQGATSQCIRIFYSNDILIENNTISGYFDACLNWGGDFATATTPMIPKSKNIIVRNNVASNLSGAGFWCSMTDTGLFENNKVDTCEAEAYDAEQSKNITFIGNKGINVKLGLNLFGVSKDIKFINNYITLQNNSTMGFYNQGNTTMDNAVEQGKVTIVGNTIIKDSSSYAKLNFSMASEFIIKDNTFENCNCVTAWNTGKLIFDNNIFTNDINSDEPQDFRSVTLTSMFNSYIGNLSSEITNNSFTSNTGANQIAMLLAASSENFTETISNNNFSGYPYILICYSSSLKPLAKTSFINNVVNGMGTTQDALYKSHDGIKLLCRDNLNADGSYLLGDRSALWNTRGQSSFEIGSTFRDNTNNTLVHRINVSGIYWNTTVDNEGNSPIQAWVKSDSSGNIVASYGISSISYLGTGVYEINLDAGYNNDNYCIIATASNNLATVDSANQNPGYFRVTIFDTSSSAVDDNFYCAVIGTSNEV